MLGVTEEEKRIAELVVEKSKREAEVDTGRLKRSINKKVQRGIIVFREYFYGEFKDSKGKNNSTLEDNARQMMGNIPYKLERLNEAGAVKETETKYASGRSFKNISIEKRKSNAQILIQKILDQRKKDGETE